MTTKASQMSDEIMVAADEIKVAVEMGVTATVPDILVVPGHFLHIGHSRHSIVADAIKEAFLRKFGFFALGELGHSGCKFIPVQIGKRFPDIVGYADLESGVKTEEVVCEFCWKSECPKYVGYAHFERILKELKDKGNALKFMPFEIVKELKDECYGVKWIQVESMEELKDNGFGLKFIPVETVRMSKNAGCELKFVPVERVKELKEDGYALFIHAEAVKKFKDEKMESVGVIEAVVDELWWKKKCIEYFGYANDYIEKTVKPEMGLLFSGATMQNIYQLVTSEMVTTGRGKTLMKLNEAAFMMLLYGLVMPRRAAGNFALAIGIALASAAYLVTLTFAF